MRKAGLFVAASLPLAVAGFALMHPPPGVPPKLAPPPPTASPLFLSPLDPLDDERDEEPPHGFRLPSGEPTALSCDDARVIVEQVRAGLAYPPGRVSPAALATSAADWLDPHGLFSVARDAPSVQALRRVGAKLLADIEGRGDRACASADAPGDVLEAWVDKLRESFDRGRSSPGDLMTAALEPLPPTGNAHETAEELGRRAGAFERAHGEVGALYADEARRRLFPPLDGAGWAKVVLASAVRAYVPLVDPHGEWAPYDEESRIYEVDLASRPPPRLWGRFVLTAIGVRVMDSAAAPLAVDDVVLSVAGISTAGLPLEQVDQLGLSASDGKRPVPVVVLRAGEIVSLDIGGEEELSVARDPGEQLPFERVGFGEGDALVVAIKEVQDDLGDDLAALIGAERARRGRPLVGIVLDLRGNGGGSTDGAASALSLFLPGAPLFAMKRRDGAIEIDRAPVPFERDRWAGPVATFVDGTTASAAEMIAGALAAYRRGPSVGAATFGKGCAQEYVDDDAHAGVLRLTTLVYALPDGTPVQRVGLTPQVRFPFALDPDASLSRERGLALSAPPWRGPDVRDLELIAAREEAAWPSHGGNVGPCQESDVCKALRLLGGGTKRTPTAKY